MLVEVNPKNTSKTCSECGSIQEMPLSERTFNCKKCGMSKDRDLNASINILKRATTAGLAGSHAFGDDVRPQGEAVIAEKGTIFDDKSSLETLTFM